MKHLFLAISLVFFISCSSDDNGNSDDSQNPEFAELEADIQLGTWEISSFIDRGEDKTDNFDGYEFTFSADGIVIGQNNLFSEPGTWSYTVTTNGDFVENFNLQFNGTEPFPDLSEDWVITAASETSVTLLFDTVDVNKSLQFNKL